MRTTLVGILVASLFLALAAPATVGIVAAQNDANEPNDDFATATPIDPGTYGSLSLVGEELDYYAIELEAGETLDAHIEHAEDIQGDIDVTIYDPDGDWVSMGDEFSDPTSSTLTVRATTQAEQTETYYVVVGGGDEDSRVSYSLSVAVASNDRFEANGNFAGAAHVEPGTYEDLAVLSGEEDFYAVDLSEGETLDASVEYADGVEIEPALTIYDPDGDSVEYDDEFTEPTSSTVTRRAAIQADQSGTYYVRIGGNDDYQGTSNYTLSVAVAENDRFEPNGEYAIAQSLEAGTYEDLAVLSGEQDTYAVELNEGETLDASIDYADDAAIQASLTIDGPDGDSVEYDETFSEPTGTTVTQRAAIQADQSGTYYVRVYGNDDYQGTSNYTLSVAVADNDRFESNGDIDSATPLEPGAYEDLSILSGETDYYAVELTDGATLNASVEYGDEAANEPSLVIEDSSGDSVAYGEARSSPTSDVVTESAEIQADQSGTYYVRVYGNTDYQGTSNYSLVIDAPEIETDTPTPTATDTPTETRTEKATATATDTLTATATDTADPETERDTPEPTDEDDTATATSADGPGMGLLVAVVGLLGGTLVAGRRL